MGAHREALAAALVDGMPLGVDVFDYPTADAPAGSWRVIIALDSIDPPDVACPVRVYAFKVYALTNLTDPEAVEVDLDDLVELVLAAVDDAPSMTWSKAARGVWQDTVPSIQVDVEVTL